MYGYGIIAEENPQKMSDDQLEKYVSYWGGSEAVKDRMDALLSCKQSLVVFLEYIPYTLQAHKEKLDPTVIERDLFDTVKFMMSKNMIHFDGHGWNILTDGERLYFADFGLAMSLDFELSPKEVEFFHKNYRYDQCLAADAICHHSEKISDISKELQLLLDKYKPISDRYHQFIVDLRSDETKYLELPSDELYHLLDQVGLFL